MTLTVAQLREELEDRDPTMEVWVEEESNDVQLPATSASVFGGRFIVRSDDDE